jgi:hypothetical protein
MKTRLALLHVLILGLVVSVTSTVPCLAAGDRYALVIGNAKYPDADAPLREPINDARDVADELKRDGFTVDLGENLSGEAMRRAFDRLYSKIKPGTVALIFYSGFGVQSGRQSYLIPVDAQIWTEPDVRRDGFSLETVLSEINSRGAGVKIAGGAELGHIGQWRRPQPFRAGAAQGNARSRPDGRRDAQSDPGRRHPRVQQGTATVDFVVHGRGFFVHSRHWWRQADPTNRNGHPVAEPDSDAGRCCDANTEPDSNPRRIPNRRRDAHPASDPDPNRGDDADTHSDTDPGRRCHATSVSHPGARLDADARSRAKPSVKSNILSNIKSDTPREQRQRIDARR